LAEVVVAALSVVDTDLVICGVVAGIVSPIGKLNLAEVAWLEHILIPEVSSPVHILGVPFTHPVIERAEVVVVLACLVPGVVADVVGRVTDSGPVLLIGRAVQALAERVPVPRLVVARRHHLWLVITHVTRLQLEGRDGDVEGARLTPVGDPLSGGCAR
jgi:hypothetical protein